MSIYQYPVTTKLSLTIILIKQLNICICFITPDAFEIGHTIDII